MQYPTTILEMRAAIFAYTPSVPDAMDAYAAATERASIVDATVGVFDALSPHVDDLDADGLKLLAGCSRMMVQRRWYEEKFDEALSVFTRVSPLLPAEPTPED